MKGTRKIFLILATVLLLTAALGIYAFASTEPQAQAEESKYAFEVYDINQDKVIAQIDNPNSIGSYFKNGYIITLLKDNVVTSALYAGGANTSFTETNPYNPDNHNDDINMYLDLNGYELLFDFKRNGDGYTFIEIGTDVNFHLYSSREGGVMTTTYYNTSTQKHGSYALFNMRYNGASLIAGNMAPAAVRNGDGTYRTENTACAGDNLSTYSSAFVSLWGGTKDNNGNSTEHYQFKDITIDIDGGTYTRISSERGAIIVLEYAGDITAQNATFVSVGYGAVLNTDDETLRTYDNSAHFTNCKFYADSLIGTAGAKADISFTDCHISAKSLSSAANKAPEFTRCFFSTGLVPTTVNKFVKTSETETVTLSTMKYTYSNGVIASHPITTREEVITYTGATVDDGNYSTLTWVGTDGKSVTELWIKDENVIPVPGIIPPVASDVCKYVYYPAITSTASGDKTYTMARTVNFTLKINLTLYTDFVYNIYIPKSVVDGGNINSVKFEDSSSTVPTELETVNLSGVEYYLASREISAINGDKSFKFTMNITDPEGKTFNAIFTFSIPDYINRVLAGSYTEKQKDLVNATYTYIKAACNYYSDTVPYPVESNADLAALPKIAGTEMPERSEELRRIFSGMTLSLEGKIKFRFYIKSDIDDASKSMVFTYKVDTLKTNVAVTAEDWTDARNGTLYYDIVMRARDLLDPIKISLGTEAKATPDFSYSLAYYAFFANDTTQNIPKRDKLTKLVDALWNYSSASDKYVHGTGAPEVDMLVAGTEVTAATHVIVAGSDEYEAAAALRDAIYSVTGEQLTVSGTEVSGMSSIFVSLDTPDVNYDLRASVIDGSLYISCGYKSFINKGMESFVEDYIAHASNDIAFASGFNANYYTDRVYYSDFGAIGAGKNSGDTDFAAINNAHTTANLTKRHTVYADDGATYYIDDAKINGAVTTVIIKTNVEWGNAKFIIDDTGLSPLHSGDSAIYSKHIFEVRSDYDNMSISNADILSAVKINRNTKVIDLGLPYPAMIVPYDSDHKVYRRYDYSAWAGSNMHEIIVIDENGNVSSETPIMFDYISVDKMTVIRLDIAPIVINGGSFESVASTENIVYYNKLVVDNNGNPVLDSKGNKQYTRVQVTNENRAEATAYVNANKASDKNILFAASDPYFHRGISVKRSYTTIRGLKHTIKDEISLTEQAKGNIGPAYNGFYYAEMASHVTYEDCTMQGRRCYNKASAGLSGGTTGTYDVNATEINKLVYKNCIQSNFWITVDSSNVIHNATENTAGAELSMAVAPKININGSLKSGYQMHWGVGGSNFCKNLEYIGSTLSRLDAHAGMYNGKLIDSTINFISLTGNGDFIIENTRWFAAEPGNIYNSLVYLRSDYGSTWEGSVYIKDVEAYAYITDDEGDPADIQLFYHSYVNWYFGYECCFPNVYIDNLDYYNIRTKEALSPNHTVYLMTHKNGFSEPKLHLPTTSKTHPRHTDVDLTGPDGEPDGIVDGTYGKGNVPYDATVSTKGVEDTTSYENLNPVRPPEFVHIYNNDGVNGSGGYNYVFPNMVNSTFFDNTSIIIDEGTFEVSKDDTPIVPW